MAIPFFAVLFVLGAGNVFAHQAKEDWKDLDIPPIEVRKIVPHTDTLENGLRLFVLEDDRLPLVDISVMVKVGAMFEPADMAGLASLTGRAMRTGGTKNRSWAEVDEAIDAMAARFRTWIATESGGAYLNVHSRNLGEALEILADVLRHPAFDEEKVEVSRAQMHEEIRRQNDDPVRIAVRETMKVLYGADHPQGRHPTRESLDRIDRSALHDFHERYFAPNNVWLGIAGDVTPEAAREAVEEVFGSWERRALDLPAPVGVSASRDPVIVFAQKETEQTTIAAGHLSLRESHPDRYKLQMVDHVFGGGELGTTRLWDRIRRSEGLAYMTFSLFDPGRLSDGRLLAVAVTQGPASGKVIRILIEEFERIHEEPLTEEELALAQSTLLNQQVFDYEDPERVVRRMLQLDYFGLPADHYEKAISEFQSASREELHRAAREHVHPDRLRLVVVGDESKFDLPLADLGYDIMRIELE